MKGILFSLCLFVFLSFVCADEPAGKQKQTPSPFALAAPGTTLGDDDGGLVQIIPPHSLSTGPLVYHGGAVVSSPFLVAVFLGNFSSAQRNQMIAHLSSLAGSTELQKLEASGVHLNRFRVIQEDLPYGLPDGAISDLWLQSHLDTQVKQPFSRQLESNAVYVVLLARNLSARLGKSVSINDYAAYHNDLHATQGLIHYAVVPFFSDANEWFSHTREAVIQTILNPEGTGWYAETSSGAADQGR